MDQQLIDKRFRIEVLSKTPLPNQVIYSAMHQDYSEGYVYDENLPTEAKCGEVIVKRLLDGNRGHYGCFSEDTEVLTSLSWKNWSEIKYCDKLLAVDFENNESRFEFPKNLQKIKVNDESMYVAQSGYIDFMVTGDHRMLVSHRKKSGSFSDWYFKTADEIEGKPVRYLLSTNLSDYERWYPKNMPDCDPLIAMKLAGFFFGDGVRSNNISPKVIRFRLKLDRKIKYLKSLGLIVEDKQGDRYTIKHESLALWIHSNFSTGTDKIVPVWILNLPKDAVLAFLEGLKNSDGTIYTENSWGYDSCEKESLELIQAMLHVNGMHGSFCLNNPSRSENQRDCWRLTITDRQTYRMEVCQKGRSIGAIEKREKYSGYVYCASVSTGTLMIRRNGVVSILGNCLEHPSITLACGYFPHSTMQQLRTHRVGISFDVQSGRYTGDRVLKVADGSLDPEDVFYLRPKGFYTDREGKKYEYIQDQIDLDRSNIISLSKLYAARIKAGFSEEHARGMIPFDIRQHFVMTVNMRSLMHLMDLRWKKDAQLECQWFCDLLAVNFSVWSPEIAQWYFKNRAKKALLAP